MKPILFNTEMVRAILDDRKMVTRRVVKPQPPEWIEWTNSLIKGSGRFRFGSGYGKFSAGVTVKSPYGPGDIMYVRETWRIWRAHRYDADAYIEFKAGGEGIKPQFPHGGTDFANRDDYDRFTGKWGVCDKWHPSIHMPREAARIFLRVKDVWVEQLQDIDDDGVVAEGLEIGAPFDELWDSTVKKSDRAIYGWDANPWVWVIEFERISREEVEK